MTASITEARVLVAGGRGIGGPEGFQMLRRAANLLGGEIACSRACLEAGWIDTAPQVGQTRKTVRPDLYLACGISGAFQHVTGMENSGLIISINKNPAAPIFDISDLGIVGSVEIILPALIQALEQYYSE
jgi:electron transfer flavoprotein alpha subunit